MTKIYTTLILLCSNFLIIIANEEQNRQEQGNPITESAYRPLMMMKRTYFDENGEEFINFSYTDGNENIIDDGETKEERIYLCPADVETQEIKSLSKHVKDIQYCLLEIKFQENEEKRCKSQVKPALTLDGSGRIFGCHFIKTNHIFTFTIKNCISVEAMQEAVKEWEDQPRSILQRIFRTEKEKDLIDPIDIILYDICYNTDTKQTQWTRHEIIRPLLQENKSWFDEQLPDTTALSTEPYTLPNRFLEIDDAFKKQNKESTNYMVPRMLVPKDHMPYKIWKVATSHYINISAIQRELEQLMDAIDNGIRKAAITLKKRILRKNSMFLDENPFRAHNLQIYTKPYILEENLAPRYLNNDNKTLQIPDIWCKIIYYEKLNRGIAIFVHNTSDAYIDEQIKQCDKQTFCDFQEWAEHKFDQKLSKYAYCCVITKKLVTSVFPHTILITIKKLLDIEDLIEGDPQYPLDHPLTLSRGFYEREDIEIYNLAAKMKTDNSHSNTEITELKSSEIHLCPVEKLDDQNIVKYIAKYLWGFKVCLIEKNFTNEETKTCEKDIEPILIFDEQHSGKPKKCGPGKMDLAMKFIYVYCFNSQELKNVKQLISDEQEKEQCIKKTALLDDIPTIKIYNVCYNNVEMRTTYTEHRITSPSLLRLDNNTYECKKISSESYNINEKFSDMRTALNHFIKFSQYQMALQMLVPPEDFVLPLWKKTTCHFSNVSLIWNKLVPFMNRINTQIRKWAIEKSRELKVSTITFEYNGINQQEQILSSNEELNELFPIPKMWGKLVLDEKAGLGVAILIHNTPDNPPESSEFCEKTVECNFENWSSDSMQSDNSIHEELFKYAYCCEVTDKIKNIYGKEELEIKGVLDLNTLNNILEI